MVGLDQWVLEFADNVLDFFFSLGDMEDDIKRAVKFSLANEVVIGWMKEIKLLKTVLLNKMTEDSSSRHILGVDICISPYVDQWVLVSVQNVLQARIKTGESREELMLGDKWLCESFWHGQG